MRAASQQITFVSHTNRPGGGELSLRRYLQATGLPVRLVTMEAGGVWQGLQAQVVEVSGLMRLRSALPRSGLVVANSMRSAFLTSLVLPKTATLVYWVRDGLTDSAMSPMALALTRLVTARRVSHYLANSVWTAGTVQKVLRVKTNAVDVVHSMSGVSADQLRSQARTHPHSPMRLLFLGRITPWKAPHLAIRSLQAVRRLGIEATLTIAGGVHFGEDKYEVELRRLVEAEPSASLLGHVDDVTSLLSSHDVLLHCSTVPEPFGQVVVQGLAAGMAVVASNAGGPAEILAGAPIKCLYTPGDVADMAECIRENKEKYAEASAWAIRRARDYTDQHLVSLMDRHLQQLEARPAA